MVGRGARANDHLRGDLLIGISARDQRRDLPLSSSNRFAAGRGFISAHGPSAGTPYCTLPKSAATLLPPCAVLYICARNAHAFHLSRYDTCLDLAGCFL